MSGRRAYAQPVVVCDAFELALGPRRAIDPPYNCATQRHSHQRHQQVKGRKPSVRRYRSAPLNWSHGDTRVRRIHWHREKCKCYQTPEIIGRPIERLRVRAHKENHADQIRDNQVHDRGPNGCNDSS
jgi:hypothetical protein